MASRKRAATEDLSDIADRPNALSKRVGLASGQTVSPNSQRAARCLQHVRALNSQFASWVQQQARDSPDCLWQEGVGDYLKHSATLLEDFKDIVDWVKSKSPSPPPSSSSLPLPSSLPPLPSSPTSPKVQAPLSTLPFSATGAAAATTPPLNFLTPSASPPPSSLFGTPPAPFSTPSSSLKPFGASSAPAPAFSMFATSAAPGGSASSEAPMGQGLLFPGLKGFGKEEATGKEGGGGAGEEKKGSASASAPWVPSTSFMPPPMTAGFGAGFGGATTLGGGFSFGSAGGGFGSSGLAPVKTSSGVGGRSEEAKNANQEEEEEEEEKQPESPSIKGSVEEGVKVEHSVTTKLYLRDQNNWKDMGKGELSIRRKEDAERGSKGAQARILLRTDVGKLLLNANLYEKMSATVKGGGVLVMLMSAVQPSALPAKPDEEKKEGDGKDPNGNSPASKAGPEMRMYLFKVGSAEKAEELSKSILENAPNKV